MLSKNIKYNYIEIYPVFTAFLALFSFGEKFQNEKHIETRNSKGRSGSDFYWFLKIYFAAFSHQSPGEMQIWLTHQSKAIILYFDTEIFLSPVLEILRETDKVNFTNSNLMCVYTHIKFQNMKFCLSVSHKISKKRT